MRAGMVGDIPAKDLMHPPSLALPLIGRTPKGAYSTRGRSRHLLETPFSEPLLREPFSEPFFWGPDNGAFGKPCFCPARKRGFLTKMLESRETTKMTKMAGVPRTRAWFTKSTVSWTPIFYCKTHSRSPSQNPSENPSPEPCPEPSRNPNLRTLCCRMPP